MDCSPENDGLTAPCWSIVEFEQSLVCCGRNRFGGVKNDEMVRAV